ncbi:hypothetical protein EBZ37_05945, partial [bacterium]|nr:hypothetical protein [bacterium]
QPGGSGVASAKKDLDQAVSVLREEVRSALASAGTAGEQIDLRLDREIETRTVGFLDQISKGHQLLSSGEALRVKVRDYLTRATQLSVDCRVLAKSGQDSSECEKKVSDLGVSAGMDFQQHLARSVDAAKRLETELAQKSQAQSTAVTQAQKLQSFLQQVPQIIQNLKQAEAGTLRAIPHHDYWSKYHGYWAWYFGPTGPGRNPVYGQAHLAAMNQHVAALNSYQQQLGQIRSQMQGVMAQAQSAQTELNSLPTKIQNLTLDVATIKQRIVSL